MPHARLAPSRRAVIAGMTAAVLGIVITVVSLLVQLTSERYTGVAQMFLRDRRNVAVMAYYVVTCVVGVALSLSLHNEFVPRAAVFCMMCACAVGLIMMLAGWVVAVLGFMPADAASRALSPAIAHAVRIFGFLLMASGASVCVMATVGVPVLVVMTGMALNLAHQAELLGQESTGIAGAGLVLLGTLWSSRAIRKLP